MSNKLDKEEQEILGSYENDEWVSVSSPSDIAKGAVPFAIPPTNSYDLRLIAWQGTQSVHYALTF